MRRSGNDYPIRRCTGEQVKVIEVQAVPEELSENQMLLRVCGKGRTLPTQFVVPQAHGQFVTKYFSAVTLSFPK